jgi:hypothetical protein
VKIFLYLDQSCQDIKCDLFILCFEASARITWLAYEMSKVDGVVTAQTYISLETCPRNSPRCRVAIKKDVLVGGEPGQISGLSTGQSASISPLEIESGRP